MDSPEYIKKANDQQLHFLQNRLDVELPLGSSEQRKYAAQIRLLKKLNERELKKQQQSKRKSTRFS